MARNERLQRSRPGQTMLSPPAREGLGLLAWPIWPLPEVYSQLEGGAMIPIWWLPLTAFAAFALGAVIGRVSGRRLLERAHKRTLDEVDERQIANERGSIRALIEYRAAVHEAGHAVCAWFSPYTKSIDRISIEDTTLGDGRVCFTYIDSGKTDVAWYQLVIHLGGIAAEMHAFGKMRSGPSKRDLTLALQCAKEIGLAGVPHPPWTDTLKSEFDMSEMYRSVDADSRLAQILNLAYARARYLCDKDNERLNLVADDLARHGVLEEPGIRRIFGHRPSLWGWPR